MRYDDDRYLDHDDDELWDDELELSSDDRRPMPSYHDRDEQTAGAPANDDGGGNDYYADPEPEPEAEPEPEPEPEPEAEPEPAARRRSRLPGFLRRKKKKEDDDDEEYEDEDDDDDDDDDDNDYFDSSESRPKRRKPKAPKLDPEDPDYWISDEEDSPLSGIMPSSGSKWKWQLAAAGALIVVLSGIWGWFFRPYADSAVTYGYIRNMERRGSLFKTFEGTLIPYKELGDPDPLYFHQLPFSVASDSLAAQMKRMMLGCVPVRVEYETYHAPLPWKGESRMVVVRADTTDLRKILPPEYRPKL